MRARHSRLGALLAATAVTAAIVVGLVDEKAGVCPDGSGAAAESTEAHSLLGN